ncbi:hypothetical protein SEA_JONJAMES_5 [Gordonia Phage JonJames]|nr:hypothetical protein SEA_JONJAMES_5 [Gordonia Phage JonJames]
MGDRANIYLVDNVDRETGKVLGGIYLYTHWRGHLWPETLGHALDSTLAQDRWDDPEYLARIITQYVFADLVDSSSGGGISTRIGDNGHDIIVVDLYAEKVYFASEGREKDSGYWRHGRSYADYVDTVLNPGWQGECG